jgi:predicted nuclease of predicted toxin-antitoxin system
VKLLFDQNLSPRLVEELADIYPNSTHVCQIALDRSPDLAVWSFARNQGYVIVSQDADFSELSVLFGFPPKVIWIRLGNCATQEIEAILRLHRDAVAALNEDPSLGMLTLF